MASAISAITSRFRPVNSLAPPTLDGFTPPLFRLPATPVLEFCSAGARPNTTPVSSATAAVNRSAFRSSRIDVRPSTVRPPMRRPNAVPLAGLITLSARTPTNAIPSPAAALAADSSTLSVSSCRTSRARLAPTARRMAISRLRTVPRANSRLAMFTHAINSTKLTAPNSTRTAVRSEGSIRASPCVRALAPQPLTRLSGYTSSIRDPSLTTSLFACPASTPLFSRATIS